jgi:hypothetical protein
MNTGRKPVVRFQGRHCEHVSLLIGDQRIRAIRPVGRPGIDPKTGRIMVGECPVPRCGRISVRGE